MVHGLCFYLCLWYDCIWRNQFVNVNENHSQLEGEAMTEDELKDMILECICYLIEDGSMNELLRDVIMEVLTDTTPLVKVAVH